MEIIKTTTELGLVVVWPALESRNGETGATTMELLFSGIGKTMLGEQMTPSKTTSANNNVQPAGKFISQKGCPTVRRKRSRRQAFPRNFLRRSKERLIVVE